MKNPFQHGSSTRRRGTDGTEVPNGAVTETLPHLASSSSPSTQQSPTASAEEQPTAPLATMAQADAESGPPEPTDKPVSASRRRRRWPVVAAATAFILVGTGAFAYGQARKTINLDVDGKTTQVVTFSKDVGSLLDEQDIKIGPHDVVAPAKTSALHKGGDVVVRTGHKVTYQSDGATHTVWVNDLDASDALNTLDSRGDDVRLVASRSDADGRVSLPLVLNVDGPVNLVADGKTRRIQNAGRSAAQILDSAGVSVGPLDRVSVVRDDPSVVSLVVQRVKVSDVTTTSEVAFGTEKVSDPSRYKDLPAVVKQKGVPGVHTTVKRVTTVDGKVETEVVLSDKVTTQATKQIVAQGTKERPKASSSSASSSSSSSGASSSPAPVPQTSSAVSGDVWAKLAQCESGGNPRSVSANGKYHGLYQFSVGTWQAMGGTGLPSQASAAEQTARAKALQARSGWGQWPACASKLGLR